MATRRPLGFSDAIAVSRTPSSLAPPPTKMAPGAIQGLPQPDAIFIGGGASDDGVLDIAIASLKPGGRLVANAVTLETEALLIARHASLGGELTRIAISRASPVGEKSGWRSAMPVTQWVWTKP